MKTVQVLFALALAGATCVAAIDEYDYFYNYIQDHQTFYYTGKGLLELYYKTYDQKAKKLNSLIKDWTPADCDGESFTSIYSPKLRETDQESPVLAKYIAECEKMRQILCHLNNADWNDSQTGEYLKSREELPEKLNVKVKENIDELKQQVGNWDCSKHNVLHHYGRYAVFGKLLDSVKAVIDPIIKEYDAYCFGKKAIILNFNQATRMFEENSENEYAEVSNLCDKIDRDYSVDVDAKNLGAVQSLINEKYKPKQPKFSLLGGKKFSLKKSACEKYLSTVGSYAETILTEKDEQSASIVPEQGTYLVPGKGASYVSRQSSKFYKDMRAYIYCKKFIQE